MPRKAVNYNKTIIYKLVNNNDFDNENIYVGSTTEFIKRKYHHKNCCCNENSKGYNCKVYQNIRANGGWENWTMLEIEKFPCEDKREAEAREEYWRCMFNARLNTIRAFITQEQRKEQRKENQNKYRTENAEKMKEYEKQYKTEHADKIKEQMNQYRTQNADKIKEQRKQYYTKNAEKIKQYRTENADKIKQYYTENADKLRQKYDCDCGSVYTHKSKSQHFKSNKHQNYIKNKIEMI